MTGIWYVRIFKYPHMPLKCCNANKINLSNQNKISVTLMCLVFQMFILSLTSSFCRQLQKFCLFLLKFCLTGISDASFMNYLRICSQ